MLFEQIAVHCMEPFVKLSLVVIIHAGGLFEFVKLFILDLGVSGAVGLSSGVAVIIGVPLLLKMHNHVRLKLTCCIHIVVP